MSELCVYEVKDGKIVGEHSTCNARGARFAAGTMQPDASRFRATQASSCRAVACGVPSATGPA